MAPPLADAGRKHRENGPFATAVLNTGSLNDHNAELFIHLNAQSSGISNASATDETGLRPLR